MSPLDAKTPPAARANAREQAGLQARGLGAPLACLNEARYGIAWGAVGAAKALLAYGADGKAAWRGALHASRIELLDLIDEAGSRLRIEIDSLPQEIDEVERRVTQLEIEKQALSQEEGGTAMERLAGIEEELAELTPEPAPPQHEVIPFEDDARRDGDHRDHDRSRGGDLPAGRAGGRRPR